MDSLWFFLTLTLDIVPFVILSVFLLKKYLPCKLGIALLKNIIPLILYNAILCITYMNGLYNATVMVVLRMLGIVVAWLSLCLTFQRFYLAFAYKCLVALPYMLGILVLSAFCIRFIDTSSWPNFMWITLFRMLFYGIFGYPYYRLERDLLIINFESKETKSWIGFIIGQLMLNLAMVLTIKTDYAENGVDAKAFALQMVMVLASMSVTVFFYYVFHLLLENKVALERQERDQILLDLNKRQYDTISTNIEMMRHIRHDMKHHIRTMEKLLESQKYDELKKYLEEYEKNVPQDAQIHFCSKLSINALLEHYYFMAKDNSIDATFSFEELSDATMDDFDLNIILGNAIENSIEACLLLDKEHRFIKAQAKLQAGNLFITIDNPFNGIVKNKEGALLSTKRNFAKAGYGNASMDAIAKKYNGDVKREILGNSYLVSIVLKNTK